MLKCMEKTPFPRQLVYIVNIALLFYCRDSSRKRKLLRRDFTFSRRFWQTKNGIENINQKKPTIIEHLAFLSVKHGVYLSELFQTLVAAREQGTATRENLTIKYRGRIGKDSIF